MKGTDLAANEKSRRDRARKLALKLRPKDLNDEEKKEWMRLGSMLADPVLDRLKPHFVDAALMLVRVSLRIRAYDRFFAENKVDMAEAYPGAERVTGEPGLDAEIYMVEGRNGIQLKSHPHVAQRNECWRQWRSLISLFGLTPTDERNMAPGQSDLFDPASEFD
ncbi:P27 family phage terminase small subunit [Pseudolabrys sp. Root1462]|uniref:P27 family phage terminase small subunit n=1 Tax=Pseudolabrys sp. Root1462 TaxID=1736466 RepID=UPI00138EE7FD|nr:P27 family phage terminase small subunit [Pseudolabrys sp. Root1462]